MNIVGHFINGKKVNDSERTQDVYNPSTGEVSKQVALASETTVDQAISAAQAAFPAWRNMPALRRARVMFKFKDLLEEN
ncbi:aldehyde dehydrogenase family protein, partial [Alteromonas abrolhosensis]|uniref:aldehyde dehydrogenase family protein n=1 Tax=Alteromonas abrolhosensis TaxID=1892904 RepID=UPI003BAB6082